jgi:hypothetical protein
MSNEILPALLSRPVDATKPDTTHFVKLPGCIGCLFRGLYFFTFIFEACRFDLSSSFLEMRLQMALCAFQFSD